MVDVINEKYPVKALNQNLGDHGACACGLYVGSYHGLLIATVYQGLLLP